MTRGVLALVLALAACGGKQPAPASPGPTGSSGSDPGVAQDTRSPLEKRRDAACEVVAKRVTACAVEDTKADFAAGKITKQQLDKDTAPEVVAKNAEKYADTCKSHRDYSSRQIRVLEKCPDYETECGPLLQCLDHVQPEKK